VQKEQEQEQEMACNTTLTTPSILHFPPSSSDPTTSDETINEGDRLYLKRGQCRTMMSFTANHPTLPYPTLPYPKSRCRDASGFANTLSLLAF
jgi:hypothetical protein